ncbi:hypothetical protein [Candidatus Villigracilis saccharophilus]|uniref:hypothetical protein n=1 Tax=Candidatus Villigracilis saccharophilus TaxID=3140684 RepID=UPI0031351B48|nr:hypothetical protein [Anaerolineales bacterium]
MKISRRINYLGSPMRKKRNDRCLCIRFRGISQRGAEAITLSKTGHRNAALASMVEGGRTPNALATFSESIHRLPQINKSRRGNTPTRQSNIHGLPQHPVVDHDRGVLISLGSVAVITFSITVPLAIVVRISREMASEIWSRHE